MAQVQIKLDLYRKLSLLALVPFVFALVFVAALGYLQLSIERQSHQANLLRNESNTANKMIRDIYYVERITSRPAVGAAPAIRAALKNLDADLDGLRQFAERNPAQREALEHVKEGVVDAKALLNEYEQAFLDNSLSLAFKTQMGVRETNAVRKMLEIVPVVKRQQEEQRQNSSTEQARSAWTEPIVWSAFGLTALLCAGVAFFAGQSLTSRLAIVTENAFRLARALPLNRPISGDDEIAQLDHMFHAMAESVAESTSKERAVIANAVDVICSIGAQGRFTAVNPASLAMLGYPCEELIGTDYIELIPSQDAAAASDCLEKAMQGAVAPPFETRVKRKNGTVIDVRWTVHWSARDKSLFCGLHDISERKAAERMKQEVLAMITHDLRTPLTTIRHVIEMADAGKIGSLNEEGERLCADADQSAVRILSLIDDLLGMERMRAGMMELNLATTTIASIFEQALHSVSGLAKERQVEIEMSPSDIRVHADRDRVIQVLVNLISNAIKFSPEQTTVAVSATSIGGMIEIRVVDQGRGIAAEKLDSVFERFQQVEKNDQAHFTSGSSSSGLGLAICKAIVLLHGGTIRVESKESEGSTFAFTLPASAP